MSFLKGIGTLVGTVAPTLATALGGPLAGMAVTAIGNALGLADGEAVDGIPMEKAIQLALKNPTAEQLVALKKAEQAFVLKLKELDVDVERIHAQDRDSARQREVATGDVWTPRVLAALTLLAFMACIVFVFCGKLEAMDAAQIGLIGGVIGYASAKADTVIAYYFGSSKESEEKTTFLWNSTPQK